jgi:ABC-2 type transport system ATP-binding protein
MIDAKNLTKKFGEVTAVDGLTFNVAAGEIFGFLGPNGAGKTTTMRMLCGLISLTGGEIKIDGLDIADPANSLKIRKMIGLLPDSVGLYEELTAYENLEFFAKLYEVPKEQIQENIEKTLKMFGMLEQKDQAVGGFSKGMKQKVALARALIHDPKILFMDEPTANLDPEAAKIVRDFILKLKKDGKTIFLNTHNLDEAQRICDRIGILKTRLLAVNTPEQLKKSVWGSKTIIQLEKVDDKILVAVKKLNPKNLKVEENRIIIDVAEPLHENPTLVKAIVSAGGNVQFITERNPDLEEAYLKIVEEK